MWFRYGFDRVLIVGANINTADNLTTIGPMRIKSTDGADVTDECPKKLSASSVDKSRGASQKLSASSVSSADKSRGPLPERSPYDEQREGP